MLSFFFECLGFPGGSDSKESACNVGNPGSIPGSGRSPGEGNGIPLVHGVAKSQILKVSDFTFTFFECLLFSDNFTQIDT